ncbi:MAG: hypothetical protein RI988_2299 [Pseudomonadota bacterium]|jgi:flagellar biosynthesis protein FlhG
MISHTPNSRSFPVDQAQGLRERYAGTSLRYIALAANPYLDSSAVAATLERLTAALGLFGRRTLVIDAADSSPRAPEGARIDVAMCVESLSPDIWYLPARGLPTRFVDTRGSAAQLLDQATAACHGVDVVLVHASATDLSRIFAKRALRPLLLAADQAESVTHAYGNMKLLARRCEWLSADLLLVGPEASLRLPRIAHSLSGCADTYVGSVITGWAPVDPESFPGDPPGPQLCRLVAAQLGVNEGTLEPRTVRNSLERGLGMPENPTGVY